MKTQGGQMENAMAQMQQQLANMPPEQRKMVEQMMAKQGLGMGNKANSVKVCISKEQAERAEERERQRGRAEDVEHRAERRADPSFGMRAFSGRPSACAAPRRRTISRQAPHAAITREAREVRRETRGCKA